MSQNPFIPKVNSAETTIESDNLDVSHDTFDDTSGGGGTNTIKKTVYGKGEVSGLNHDIYNNLILEDYVYLKPADLNSAIDVIILKRLKDKVEGRCIKPGYLIPNTVKIISRSLGMINNANFDGTTTYKVKYSADVCNPAIGQIVQCIVGNIDKAQVICYIENIENASQSPVEIYLFKHHHVGNVEFSMLKDKDIVNVKIAGSKFKYRDTQIMAIAQFLDKV